MVDHPFEDYWDVFVLKHQHNGNVALHCLAFALMYASVGWAILAAEPLLLLLVPVSQLTGILGHVLFERSQVDIRDAVFSWRVLWGLHRMFFLVLTGRYGKQVERIRGRLAEMQQEEVAFAE